jgi:hypothetical protein
MKTYLNIPVIVANIELNEGSGDFVLSLTLVSDLSAGFKLFSGNWDPQIEKEFSNDNPLACMVSEKLKTLHAGVVDIDLFTTDLMQIIDEFNEVVHTQLLTP